MNIGVLGAGIIGLNTALRLQTEFPNAQVTVIADKFEQDTLSYGAAGIFRPGTNLQGPSPKITQAWINDSYEFYDDILRSSEADRAGIFQTSGYIFASKFASITRNKYLEDLLPSYRQATEDELQLCPGNWKYGAYFTTMVIESGDFLPWAKTRFEAAGGQVWHRRLESFSDFGNPTWLDRGKPFDYVFNCTGFSAKWLCSDSKVSPVRGQVYKVRAPWIKMFFYGDYDTYVIPGRNAVTLGGCRQLDSYNQSVDRHDSASIWDKCTALVPSLSKATVVKEWVGLRPHRDPVRTEVERIQIGGEQELKVIHHYGHGGYGVTVAPGSSKYCVDLLKEDIRGRHHLNWSRTSIENSAGSSCSATKSKL